jgi:hypothetical protein
MTMVTFVWKVSRNGNVVSINQNKDEVNVVYDNIWKAFLPE